MTKSIPTFQELIKGRQHNRMLRLSFPHGNAPDARIVVDSIDAVESISRDFEYKVALLFKIAGACYSQPHFDKVAGNFSIRSGSVISQRKMLKMYAPDLLKAGVTFDPNFISLSEDAVQYLLEQNENLFKSEAMASCEPYFRSAAFHIWLRDGALILTPGFSRPNSICFKEYSIRPI